MNAAAPQRADYEAVIGLETHVQLTTDSKMFCGCNADYHDAEPNLHTCPTCLGLPGALPVVNQRAVEYALMIGLALGCELNSITKFDRKNYNYPDLLKGYQISQNDLPICVNGAIELGAKEPKTVRINRVHMEEDVARLIHSPNNDASLLDANRSGVPLIEIVTEPDFRSPEDAEEYIKALQQIIRYLGVGDAKMEAGSFRCDANVSVRPRGATELGTKVEIKNMNRINAVTRALKYEIARQTELAQSGGKVIQETRGWDDEKRVTVSQRVKENANDYRYFPEPDIPPLKIEDAWLAEIKERLPELPAQIRARLTETHGLSDYDARLIASNVSAARFFEEAVVSIPVSRKRGELGFGKDIANWINTEMVNLCRKRQKEDIGELGVSPKNFAIVVDKFRRKELNNQSAKLVLDKLVDSDQSPEQIIESEGLRQLSDAGALSGAVDDAVKANPKAVKDYQAGKSAAVKFLVGQVMALTRGKADPNVVATMLQERLDK